MIRHFIDCGINYDIIKKIENSINVDNLEKYNSFIKLNKNISTLLNNHDIDNLILKNELIKMFIPPGLKGTIKGNFFNKLIFDILLKYSKNKKDIEIGIEKKFYKNYPKCDCYIKYKNKKLILYNQLTLWGGGAQNDRNNYIFCNKNDNKNKIICVVCMDLKIPKKGKTKDLLEKGIKDETLFYPNHLIKFFNKFFNE